MTYPIRGIEHIGITVPDHTAAVDFFVAAFGAEPMFSQTASHGGPISAEEVGAQNGLAQGRQIVEVSVLRLQNGPNIEIFQVDLPDGPSETNIALLGISHFSLTVDSIERVSKAFEAAGGTLLDGPYELAPPEDCPGNRGLFGRTPWGLLIEMQELPAPMTYLPEAEAERWLPSKNKDA